MSTMSEIQSNVIVMQQEAPKPKGYTLSWQDLGYKVTDKKTNEMKEILQHMNGYLEPGSILAVLGASGAGKSSFLDVISGRKLAKNVSGQILINGRSDIPLKHVSRYCTQEDALFGSLTVRETLIYAARFNLPETMSENEIINTVDEMIQEFGLKDVQNVIIGTPLWKGCSGGQVRRVSVASQIIGMKSGILFLDEPTSGLDSVAANSVIDSVKHLAKDYNSTVIATIHQPSTETFNLFTHVLIMGKGSTVFFGPREDAITYFESIDRPIPTHSNPSDVYLQMTNMDFMTDKALGQKELQDLVDAFRASPFSAKIIKQIEAVEEKAISAPKEPVQYSYVNGTIHQTRILINRALLNAAKNPLAFWIRVIMYLGLAFLMGTYWLRLDNAQSHVTDRMISLYFSVAFLSFMAVAGIPAFLEERHVFVRERANGLYGIESYLLANFLVSIPFLAIIAISFSVLAYFLMGYQQDVASFFIFLGYMFVMLLIAEAQTMFISVAIPIFVAALAISAFTNGLWMVVQGFGVARIQDIPAGWRYTFHYIDYQKYAYEAILKNEMTGLIFDCAKSSNGCACLVPSTTGNNCTFSGEDVMTYYQHNDVNYGQWVGILFVILFVFKAATYLILKAQGIQSK